jgi:predicted nucleic acid-binding protein
MESLSLSENVVEKRVVWTSPAPDLVDRDFTASRPDELWVPDITCVPTDGGYLYLSVVLDAFSRRVVGWAAANHLRTELVLEALDMGAEQRSPEETNHHSDWTLEQAQTRRPEGPEAVCGWIETSPPWLSVRSARARGRETSSGHEEKCLQPLDPGEREAIRLAEDLLAGGRGAGLLLINEQAGREVARARGLEVTGTIGVLGATAKKGHVDAARATAALRDTTFRASPDLYRWLLR